MCVAVQQKDNPLSTSTSAVTLVTSSPASVAIMAVPGSGTPASSSSSPVTGDFQIPTTSADVASDIAKYTNKVSIVFRARKLTVSMFRYTDFGTFT